MRSNTRTRRTRSRRGRTYLDPHYFNRFSQKRAEDLVNSRKVRPSRVSYQITTAEVLEDLSYGRD
ncbi:MAG: hypothetical protein OEM15_18210 [Myxococcales bacterium]|nr:hypothetical protein [Myxococcales bacterium]MDH3483542.1 hypothetical protein [Myxococcales bacterium]